MSDENIAARIVVAAISAARSGAMLHPLPEEGQTVAGHMYQIAEAYSIAGLLADEVERLLCIEAVAERAKRGQQKKKPELPKLLLDGVLAERMRLKLIEVRDHLLEVHNGYSEEDEGLASEITELLK